MQVFPQGRVSVKRPALICVCIVLGMLIVGLFPFGRPRNDVNWLTDTNGLSLTGRSFVLSQGVFTTLTNTKEATRSLEFWLQPGRSNVSSTILAFSLPDVPNQLLLVQYGSSLIVTREKTGRRQRIGLANVFQQGKGVFVTVTAGSSNTDIYVNGVLAETFPGFRLAKDMTGRLVIGTAPEGDDNWHGELSGLAIYSQELTAEQVSRHYRTWTQRQHPEVSKAEGAIALYLFNEHAGDTVRNSVSPGINLVIPAQYYLVHQKFLEPFWEEYRPNLRYWDDIVINIIGFIPLGFAYFALWSFIRPTKHPILCTLMLGFAVSLTIEVIQSVLPTRSSGTTDLITNTLGTYLGVELNRLGAIRNLIVKASGGLSPQMRRAQCFFSGRIVG